MDWQKKEKLGVQENLLMPVLSGLRDVLEHEKKELELKLKNLKMLGIIAMDGKMNVDEINKHLEELKR